MVVEEIVNSLLVAQKSSWENLVQVSKTNKIANGYLFSGPIGSGKEVIALKFSQLLNCESSDDKICHKCGSCIRFNKLQHENFHSRNMDLIFSNYLFPKIYLEVC